LGKGKNAEQLLLPEKERERERGRKEKGGGREGKFSISSFGFLVKFPQTWHMIYCCYMAMSFLWVVQNALTTD
jgi:hypothetical protein